jgi:hypothetical protein
MTDILLIAVIVAFFAAAARLVPPEMADAALVPFSAQTG